MMRAVTVSTTGALSNFGLVCKVEMMCKAEKGCRAGTECRFGEVCRWWLACRTEAARRPVFEWERMHWAVQSSPCSDKAAWARRTEVQVWSRAEWAAAAAGSCQLRLLLR